ncbi:MAG: DedA family protein [Phycisphaerales bacterium]|nr:DedA family protein [Phycisphaerales bacterium]
MEWLTILVDFILHFDRHLDQLIQQYGAWTYAMLFGIIFAETGLVFAPFLPGDSLLFAAGAFAARGSLSFPVLLVLLTIAGVLGDSVNYAVGRLFGTQIIAKFEGRFIKREHLDRTHEFFERYGGKTIIIARFVPIIRTLAPFVAGIGAMNYSKFVFYNVVGGIMWVVICVGAGYVFGGFEFVQKNFELVVLAIIFVSILPAIIEFWRARAARPRVTASADAQRGD